MIAKQNQPVDDEDNQSRIKLIAEKRKTLEEKSAEIQAEIRTCFEELVEVLRSRERQLLRQAEAIHRQQLSLVETSLDFLPSSIAVLDGKSELEEQICRFGNIDIHGANGITVKDVEPYKVVDYQDANKDHVSFDKSITCQKIRDRLSLPRYKDFVSDYKTLRISSMPPAFLIENQLRDARSVKDLQDLANETTEDDLQELDKKVTSQNDAKAINGCPKEQEKSCEHPMQVQHWLRQILAETEIEPAIHEIGQFSEISNVKLCNEL
ncbi:uncharacterized protein LOC116844468 isoform X3 [Odontomachus brunneus]|uniref:uncharacterized protein LOC116844468 isoform X3 n=1 Tax=Odontomachus brunneus TaxID=486640 RepID=UPI0013F288A3|nr:uncharacterized protein LOC116844468 isoform X3 [Odontomachus brunneus]